LKKKRFEFPTSLHHVLVDLDWCEISGAFLIKALFVASVLDMLVRVMLPLHYCMK